MAHSEHKKEEIHVHYTSLAGEHGDQGRRTYEYGNPIHHTGLTGDYDTHGRQTDQHGNPVYHAGLTGEYGDQGRQTDHGNPVYRAGLTGDYGTQGPQRVGVGTGDKYGAPGTTGAYPTTGNIPYAGTEAGGEAWKEKHGTTGAYPTRANVPYAGADVDPGFGREHKKQEHHGRTGTGVFGRSGNSSSSSSEDDGEGGRRKKKGLKEKLPGGHKEATSTTTPGYHGYNKDDKDKKGTVEKIKEKLPGTRQH